MQIIVKNRKKRHKVLLRNRHVPAAVRAPALFVSHNTKSSRQVDKKVWRVVGGVASRWRVLPVFRCGLSSASPFHQSLPRVTKTSPSAPAIGLPSTDKQSSSPPHQQTAHCRYLPRSHHHSALATHSPVHPRPYQRQHRASGAY